jgi:hypothetical protein
VDRITTDYRKYRVWFTLLLVVVVGGFVLASLAYNGRFNLLTDPFSRLGASETPDGDPNRASMAIFIIDMVITAILFSCLAVVFFKDKEVPFRGVRVLFSIVAALGACITTFPNNYFLAQHQLGAGFLVGSFWLHGILFILDAGRVIQKTHALLLHLLLQSTVLTYAYTFLVNAPIRDIVQKFAILGLALSIELSLSALCKEPLEIRNYAGARKTE